MGTEGEKNLNLSLRNLDTEISKHTSQTYLNNNFSTRQMEINYSKILVLVLIFLGEILAIYAEMVGAKTNHLTSQPFWQTFLKMFLLITLAGGILIAGYMLGINAFKNIWVVSVVSITSILLVEPILAWTIFHQVPTVGAVLGFILGAIGLFLSLFY